MNILVTASLAMLFAIGLGLAAFGGIRAAWRNCEGRRGVFAALAILAAVCSIVAQKVSISFDRFVADGGTYATNDVFHVAISNATNYAGVDFSAFDVLVYARQHGLTNATDWIELTPRRTFAQLPADYAIVNATNYDYMVWLDYVPPSPVHTNGVFELQGFIIDGEDAGRAAGFINSMPRLETAP